MARPAVESGADPGRPSGPEVSRGRTRVRVALRWGVALALLGWVAVQLRTLQPESFADALGRTAWGYVLACYVLTVAVYGLRLGRLRSWIESIAPERIGWHEWLDVYLKSIALGSLTPGRVGDLSRVGLLGRTGLTVRARGEIVLLDKLSDFLYVPLGLWVAADTVSGVVGASTMLVDAAGAACAAGYLIAARMLGRRLAWPDLLWGVALTVAAFALFSASNAYLFWAAGVPLSFAEVTAVVVLVGVLANLPVSIGGIGVREASLLGVLRRWNVSVEASASLVLLEFVLNVGFPLLLYVGWLGATGGAARLSRRRHAA
jgi:uncharacterized membrane protein YbhN (UPF0104 family)